MSGKIMKPQIIRYHHILQGFFYPQTTKPLLILFPAFEGPSAFCHDYAMKLYHEGFQVFIADMYGHAHVGQTLEECFTLITPFLNSRSLVRDLALEAYKTACTLEGVDPQKIGAFGFCFGGMCTLELARSGAHLKAAASLHGLLKKSDLKTNTIRPELLIMHGYQDPQVPREDFLTFADEMSSVGCEKWQFVFFGDAKHAFTDPKTGSFDPIKEKDMGRAYNQKAADRSLAYLKLFFKEAL